MTALALSLVALLAPAAFAGSMRGRPGVAALLDGVVVAAIGGLVALDVVPEAGAAAGMWALVALAIGLALPSVAERLGIGGHHVHDVGLLAGQAVLAVHSTIDGVALATAGQVGPGLATAVVLHQMPVGLAVWASTSAHFGARGAWAALFTMAGLTVAGFVAGERALAAANPLAVGIAAGAAAGSLAHVVAHGALPGSEGRPRLAGIGALVAVGAVLTMPRFHVDAAVEPFLETWGAVAPFALVALAISAVPRSSTRLRAASPEAALLALPLAGPTLATVLAVALLAAALLVRPHRPAPLPRLAAGLLGAAAVMPAVHALGLFPTVHIAARVPVAVVLGALAGAGLEQGPWCTVPLGAALAGDLGAGGVVALVVAGLPLRIGRVPTAILALVLGFLVDTFRPDPGAPLRLPADLALPAGLGLAALAAVTLLRDGPRAWLERVGPPEHTHTHPVPETP